MKTRVIILMMTALMCCSSSMLAQKDVTKARIAQIRKCYAEAQRLAEAGQNGAKKNFIHVDFHATDPTGYGHRVIDFYFDNTQILEELDIYPCYLVFVRDKSGDNYTEFLYDKEEGNLIFCYKRIVSQTSVYEERFYFPAEGSEEQVWMTEKTTDAKTKKVTEEKQYYDEGGMYVWAIREASAVKQAFEGMTAIIE